MGLFNEIMKLTRPYEGKDDEFLPPETDDNEVLEEADEPTTVINRGEYTADARREYPRQEPHGRGTADRGQDRPPRQDDDWYGQDDYPEETEQEDDCRRNEFQEQPTRTVRPVRKQQPYEQPRYEQPQEGIITTLHTTVALQVVYARARSLDQARKLAVHLQEHRALVLYAEHTDKSKSAERSAEIRVLDFLTGAAYMSGGNVKKLALNTYLILPSNTEIQDDIIEALESSGIRF